jgi:hypothetical protein
MLYLLNWRVLALAALVAVLATSHVIAYKKGASHVRTEWRAATAQANAEGRTLERARQSAADAAGRLAATRTNRIALDRARLGDELSGLRSDLDAARLMASQSIAAADQRANAYGVLLVKSGELLTELAQSCDRHASDVKLLLDAWPK